MYSSGSCPRKFHGTANLYKIDSKGLVGNLPIRPMISNINTIFQNIWQLLTPLRESQYSIKSTKDFISKIKNEKVPDGYQMVSFDVKSLFANVPLDQTIQLVLKRIYEKHEVSTNITK